MTQQKDRSLPKWCFSL